MNVDGYCLKLANTMGTHVMLLQDWDSCMYDKTHTWAEKSQGASAVSNQSFLNYYTFRSKLKNARATMRPSVV